MNPIWSMIPFFLPWLTLSSPNPPAPPQGGVSITVQTPVASWNQQQQLQEVGPGQYSASAGTTVDLGQGAVISVQSETHVTLPEMPR
ncbi:hypothetical protein [Kyrpidia tusciae]|uniref:Uncharacterized protein n=1 Tax=Kyrpidia tusciae (strain DSM 2912 / NBRC 15312 / T2) TaxID=562970 RepID=D5WWS1_KYRT2|nr:hypothetical protein [Kyrpidia tusciae]ADG05772.1 hypothetical protein Btus_1034 [Kyrpidia tusciae DSM 2912]